MIGRQTSTATQDLETSAKRCVGYGAIRSDPDPMFSEPSSKPNSGRHWTSSPRPYRIVPSRGQGRSVPPHRVDRHVHACPRSAGASSTTSRSCSMSGKPTRPSNFPAWSVYGIDGCAVCFRCRTWYQCHERRSRCTPPARPGRRARRPRFRNLSRVRPYASPSPRVLSWVSCAVRRTDPSLRGG